MITYCIIVCNQMFSILVNNVRPIAHSFEELMQKRVSLANSDTV